MNIRPVDFPHQNRLLFIFFGATLSFNIMLFLIPFSVGIGVQGYDPIAVIFLFVNRSIRFPAVMGPTVCYFCSNLYVLRDTFFKRY
jgi:hypothetical protein